MPAWERELGELPSPIWSLSDRKVGQGPYVFGNGMMECRSDGLKRSPRTRTPSLLHSITPSLRFPGAGSTQVSPPILLLPRRGIE